MELENIVANTVYIKARDATDKGRSKKWRKLLRFPHIRDCSYIIQQIPEQSYNELVVNQPIGKKLFTLFCETVPHLRILIYFLDDLECLEMSSPSEQANHVHRIKAIYLHPHSAFFLDRELIEKSKFSSLPRVESPDELMSIDDNFNPLAYIVQIARQCFDTPSETGEKGTYSECTKAVLSYLSTTAFKMYCPDSIFFKRYIQWKWLEMRPCSRKQFRMYRVLGKGGFGEVCGCQSKLSGKMYAMKLMEKKRIKKRKGERMALNEKDMLEKINSRFVVSLAYAFETKDELCLVLTLLVGGDLKFHIHHLYPNGLEMNKVVFYTGEIGLGLGHLHHLRIAYRDLKPENCLLDDQGHVRISDLGLAIEIPEGKSVSGRVGTVGYMAPEVVAGHSYTFMPDWFSFGCLVYEMIEGRGPFRKPKERVKREEVERRVRSDEEKYSNKFSVEAQSFCSALLQKEPRERIGYSHGIDSIKLHPFFDAINMRRLEACKLDPPFRPDPKAVYCRDVLDIEQFSTVKGVQLDKVDKVFFERFNTGAVSIPWQQEMIETNVFAELNTFSDDLVDRVDINKDYSNREMTRSNFLSAIGRGDSSSRRINRDSPTRSSVHGLSSSNTLDAINSLAPTLTNIGASSSIDDNTILNVSFDVGGPNSCHPLPADLDESRYEEYTTAWNKRSESKLRRFIGFFRPRKRSIPVPAVPHASDHRPSDQFQS